MKKSSNKLLSIIIRYLFLLSVAFPNMFIFYFVFTPLTVYPVYFLFNLFYEASLLNGNLILLNRSFPIELIKSCIAGSAYYLLLILNLSVPNIKITKRLKMIFLSFAILLILNILRIFFLGLLFVSGSGFLNLGHKLFWYLISTVFVIGIWFFEVKFFKIKDIPFYSDVKFLHKKLK